MKVPGPGEVLLTLSTKLAVCNQLSQPSPRPGASGGDGLEERLRRGCCCSAHRGARGAESCRGHPHSSHHTPLGRKQDGISGCWRGREELLGAAAANDGAAADAPVPSQGHCELTGWVAQAEVDCLQDALHEVRGQKPTVGGALGL